jgi:hypothetical protein
LIDQQQQQQQEEEDDGESYFHKYFSSLSLSTSSPLCVLLRSVLVVVDFHCHHFVELL